MAAVDHLLAVLRRDRDPQMPPDCVGRFLCTKSAWRGRYTRVLCVTPAAVVTQHPDTLAITNTWRFAGESDIDGVSVGPGTEFTLSARKDAKSRYKPVKFACEQRAALLTALYQCMIAAAAAGEFALAPKLLGSPDTFQAHKLRRGSWRPVQLRVTAIAVERLDAAGTVRWRLEFRHMASPAARLLQTSGGEPGGVCALFGKVGRSPRVHALRDREAFLRAMQTAALARMGITLAVVKQGELSAAGLLEAVGNAERERAAAPGEAPLGEWEATRIKPDYGAHLTTQALLAGSEEAKAALQAGAEGRSRGTRRRVVLTAEALLERRPATYEVAERRPLAALAAAVRFSDQPQWLALEWTDGAAPAMYITPARDALLAAVLDAAQATAGRPIPVLPQHTFPGNVILSSSATSGLSPPVLPDAELEKLCLGHLAFAARAAFGALSGASAAPAAPAEALRPPDGDGNSSEGGPAVGSPPPRQQRNLFPGRVGDAKGVIVKSLSPTTSRPEMQAAVCEFRCRVSEFNACVPYSGVGSLARLEDGALSMLLSLLPPAGVASPQAAIHAADLLQCLQRCVASGFVAASVTHTQGALARIFAALECGQEHVAAEAARLLTRLWAPASARAGAAPWRLPQPGGGAAPEQAPDDKQAARAAKSALSQPGRAAALLGLLWLSPGAAAFPVMAGLEALAAVVCEPGAATTDPIQLHALLAEAAELGRPLFQLFAHPAGRVADGAALVMRAIAENGAAAAAPMREAALSEAAVLHHLSLGLAERGPRGQLSRSLVALWADGHPPALDLLRRVLPPGLMRYLQQRRAPPPPPPPPPQPPQLPGSPAPSQPASPRARAGSQTQQPPGADRGALGPLSPLRTAPAPPPAEPKAPEAAAVAVSADSSATAPGSSRSRQQPPARTGGLKGDWDALWAACFRDHGHAGLIWNERTRAELREALQAEEAGVKAGRAKAAGLQGAPPAWNHWEFRVRYPSLARELCLGGVYVRLLVDGLDQGAVEKLPQPREAFQALHAHFLRLADATAQPQGSSSAGGQQRLGGTAAFVEGDPQADRLLCARAMAAVYSCHAGAVGEFNGMEHAAALLDRSPSAAMRGSALGLLRALLLPAAAAGGRDAAAAAAAKANGVAFVEAGGVKLLVDLLACSHEAQERVQAPLQGNLLAMHSAAEEPREWFYYRPAAAGGAEPQERVGPVTKAQIRQAFARGEIGPATASWAAGMLQAEPLGSVRELRWLVSGRAGGQSPFATGKACLDLLLALVRLQPATGPGGAPLLPLPRVHRQLAAHDVLPHVAQVLLTGEPALVAGAATLLTEALAPNRPALGALYTTGVFYFALAYCGSNLVEIARLLHVSHLEQQGRLATPGLGPLAQRSFLGGLLPESLLYVLAARGPEAFAAALAADADTPELIWTHRMRGERLVPQMLRHIGGLPARLAQHCRACWEHVACPPVGYPELTDEMWCHRYYLRNLCDSARFPAWPLVDQVPLLQALLDEWRAELARKPLGMTEGDACRLLGLEPGEGEQVAEEDLKAAYRRLARRFHPDKNPAGREQFLAVQQAYERLAAGAAGGQGPQPWRLLLILRAQCIVFGRSPEALAPFKYAGYPMLLQAVRLPAEDAPAQEHFLSPERTPRLQAAVELCWLTCVSSALNGEELTRAGGVGALGALLQRCRTVLPPDAAPSLPAALIATHCLRALAGMAAFPAARAQLAERPGLVGDVARCCSLQRAAAAVDAALQCVSQMCAAAELQELLLRLGALGHLLPLLLAFDPTHEGAAAEQPAFDFAGESAARGPAYLGLGVERTNMQAARNHHAMLAARALARLAGVLPGGLATPECALAGGALGRLLTPALAVRLAALDPRPLLGLLTATVLSPQVIWNGKMREQLLECAEAARSDLEHALPPADFQFQALQGELAVAGVFVRMYNEQPGFAMTHEEATAFCKGLVTWVNARAKADAICPPPPADGAEGAEARAARELGGRHLTAALQALLHVTEAHPRLAALLASRPALAPLLHCLQPVCRRTAVPGAAAEDSPPLRHEREVAALALAALVRLTSHAGCVEALAEERTMLLCLWLVHRPPSPALLQLALRLLHALAATPAAAWAAAAQGGAVYLLAQLLPSSAPPLAEKEAAAAVQASVATVLARTCTNPLHGPRVVLLLQRLLPPGMVTAIQDGPGEAVVAALGLESETPERVWSQNMATTAALEIAGLADAARSSQARGVLAWAPADDYELEYRELAGEVFVGGVYVRLFLKRPGAPLRAPEAFLEGLVAEYLSAVAAGTSPGRDAALLLAAAAVELLRRHPGLADHAVALGYVDRLLRLLAARLQAPAGDGGAALDDVGGSALRLLHQLAAAPAAAEAAARAAPPAAGPLMAAMARWGVAGSALALETLARALAPANRARDLLVGSLLAAGLLPLLLRKLDWRAADDGGASGGEDRDSQVERVLAIDVIRLLAAEGACAATVNEQLDKSEVWQAYSRQRHDLFLPAAGGEQGGVVALLEGKAAQFALPAPEAPPAAAPIVVASQPPPSPPEQPGQSVAAASGAAIAFPSPRTVQPQPPSPPAAPSPAAAEPTPQPSAVQPPERRPAPEPQPATPAAPAQAEAAVPAGVEAAGLSNRSSRHAAAAPAGEAAEPAAGEAEALAATPSLQPEPREQPGNATAAESGAAELPGSSAAAAARSGAGGQPAPAESRGGAAPDASERQAAASSRQPAQPAPSHPGPAAEARNVPSGAEATAADAASQHEQPADRHAPGEARQGAGQAAAPAAGRQEQPCPAPAAAAVHPPAAPAGPGAAVQAPEQRPAAEARPAAGPPATPAAREAPAEPQADHRSAGTQLPQEAARRAPAAAAPAAARIQPPAAAAEPARPTPAARSAGPAAGLREGSQPVPAARQDKPAAAPASAPPASHLPPAQAPPEATPAAGPPAAAVGPTEAAQPPAGMGAGPAVQQGAPAQAPQPAAAPARPAAAAAPASGPQPAQAGASQSPLGPLSPGSAVGSAGGAAQPARDSGSLPVASSRGGGHQQLRAVVPAAPRPAPAARPGAAGSQAGRPASARPASKKQADGQLKRSNVDFNPLL